MNDGNRRDGDRSGERLDTGSGADRIERMPPTHAVGPWAEALERLAAETCPVIPAPRLSPEDDRGGP